ncbi:MAG: S9 family peptidase [Bacteroidales bacterium]|nr:S9 family peptidase [Bacteroidales bacterium]
MNTKLFTASILTFLIFFTGFSQEPPSLTLEQVISGNVLNTKGMRSVRWTRDGKGYTITEANAAKNGQDIVYYDALTGEKKILVASGLFIPEGKEKALSFSDYTWSNHNEKLLLFTNTRRVWRIHSRGDYWVLDLKSGKLTQLGKSVPEATMMFAKFSPDDSQVAFVSLQNIYVEDINSGAIRQITFDGGKNIINGTFDWVYEEELDCRDGFRWSPDGKTIAFWQTDTEGTGVFSLINNLDSIYPEIIQIPYPKVGTSNSAVKIGVVSANGGEPAWFNIPGDPRNNYLARMEFIPNSQEVMIQQLNRLQNTNTVWVGNVGTMQLKTLLTDTDSAWVDIHDNIQWIKNGQFFTWTSERDGWRHLYLVTRDGKKSTLITKGNFDIVSISRIAEKEGYVYYIASPENFTQRYLYRSRLDGKGQAQRVSPLAQQGQHRYNISPDARFAVHIFDNHYTPPVYEMVSLPNHKQLRLFEDNKAAKEKFKSLGLSEKEFFRVNIGDVILDAWMIKPSVFDPSKKYPVIFDIYGEPAGSTVQDTWSRGLWDYYLANQGYIVMSVDNRGTNVPRGREWRKCIYGQVGVLNSADQASAVKEIGKMYSFVDLSRIGVWGWSGGGSMTLNCMFRYPEVYKTGIAVAFVADRALYDNIYEERYMGLPATNPEGFKKSSPINFAGNLKGNLMLIHGTGDDNVHYQNCERLVNELIKRDKLFSMLAYPMRSHGIYERENTSLHLYRSMTDYWLKNLPAGGK